MAGVDTLATRREHLSKGFYVRKCCLKIHVFVTGNKSIFVFIYFYIMKIVQKYTKKATTLWEHK